MARKGRKGDRVEPVFDVRVKDGTLGFGLDESDRTAAKPSGREARLPKPKAKKTAKTKAVEADAPAARKGGKSRQSHKGKSAPPRRGLIAGVGRLIRGAVHWAVVVLLISTAGVAGLVGYYWSKMPPTSEWTLPQ